MHAVYAHHNKAFESIDKAEKYLLSSLTNTYQLYVFNLYLLTEIVKYAEDDISRLENNYLENEDDYLVSDKLLKSSLVQSIIKDEQIESLMKKEKIKPIVDNGGIIDAYHQLKKSTQYKEYILNNDATDKDTFNLLKYLYYDVFMQHEVIEHYLDENWIAWEDDREFVATCVVKTMKGFISGKTDLLVPFEGNWPADASFIKNLLKGTIYDFDDNNELIKKFTKNWDVERITLIDRLLMHMGICEFLHIDSVPEKVTIDEYLELSKIYSTPKSKTFINGVLDKVLHFLIKEGRIEKIQEKN